MSPGTICILHIDMDEFKLDKTKYVGRPTDRRTPVEEACYDFLDKLGVSYFRADHDEAMTIPMCHCVEQVLETRICKNLFLCNRQKTSFYLLLINGDKVFKTKYLSAQLGCSRLSFGDEGDMQRLLGVQPGSATVLGLMNDTGNQVQLVIDRGVLENERFGCHPCKNTSTLSLLTQDVLEKIIPAMAHAPIFVDLPEEDHA